MIQRDIGQIIKNDFYKGKILVLMGARQVGKTTLTHEFGRSFENYLYVNLDNPEMKRVFETEMPLDDRIKLLFAQNGKVRRSGETLIFIDVNDYSFVFFFFVIKIKSRFVIHIVEFQTISIKFL